MYRIDDDNYLVYEDGNAFETIAEINAKHVQALSTILQEAQKAKRGKEEQKVYTFFNDPGHGWLRVELCELEPVKDKISGYSYMHGKYAYLEEDCDAAVFLKHKFGADCSFAELEKRGVLNEIYGAGYIRNYEQYHI